VFGLFVRAQPFSFEVRVWATMTPDCSAVSFAPLMVFGSVRALSPAQPYSAECSRAKEPSGSG